MPSHQVPRSMTKMDLAAERCPPRKTRVNISIQSQVQATTAARVAKPRASKAGLAARMRQENSRMSMALLKEWRPR